MATATAPGVGGGAALLAAQLGAPPQSSVEIDFKFVGWSFSDFRKSFLLGATLADVKRELVARHGPMTRLDLFRDAPDAEHELPRSAQAEGSTLRELGFGAAAPAAGGAAAAAQQQQQRPVTLFYSFVPHDATNPVLLANYLRGKMGTNAGAI